MTTTTQLLTVDAVARYFGVCCRTIRRWEKQGVLRSVRIAGTVRFDVAEISELVQRQGSK